MTDNGRKINKILFITLSNIGDVILTLPALDYLREAFPEARITVMSGPRPKEIFENNPRVYRLIIYDKHSGLIDKIRLFNELRKEGFDLIADLRNSLFGALLPARYHTSVFLNILPDIRQMSQGHLFKIKKSLPAGRQEISKIKNKPLDAQNKSLYIRPEDEEYIKGLLKADNIADSDKIIVISCGARSYIKRWAKEKFVELISRLVEEFEAKIVLVGDKDDLPVGKYIAEHSSYPVLNLCGKTDIAELSCLLENAALLITNDSANLHLAGYLGVPVVAVFGPTDEKKYGPWTANSAVAKKDIFCRPCQKAQCRYGDLKCMSLIKVEDVLPQVRNILKTGEGQRASGPVEKYKRILIVRTDRIGDVLLSTPVIKSLRENYPHSYIAVMVSPYAKDIVEGNPYLDEVIIYDKDGKHRGWRRSIEFAHKLKKKSFDLAVILHPTNRVHIVTFLAAIPRRVGYNCKFGFLLTDKIRYIKQSGEKHELEYALDLVRYLGIEPKDKSTFMPIRKESEDWVEELFRDERVFPDDKLLAINPAASCPSKVWPAERFAEAADRLIEKYGFKVLVISGPKDMKAAEAVISNMRHPAVNLSGKTSVSQLASLLKKCSLFISNDSGPVHIASSVGTPVISIFGRLQKGLSPERWGPRGLRDRILHKEVGCIECLAHNCVKGFACLKAITTSDVLNMVDSIIK